MRLSSIVILNVVKNLLCVSGRIQILHFVQDDREGGMKNDE